MTTCLESTKLTRNSERFGEEEKDKFAHIDDGDK